MGASSHDGALQALIQAFVACKLAMEAMPDLPAEIREAVHEPVAALCRAVGPELERLEPGTNP